MKKNTHQKIVFTGSFSYRDPKLIDHKADIAIKLHGELLRLGYELVLLDYSPEISNNLRSQLEVIKANQLPKTSSNKKTTTKFDFPKHSRYGRQLLSEDDNKHWQIVLEDEFIRITNYLVEYDVSLVLAWDPYSPRHRILKEFCDKTDRRMYFLETGIVPGSYEIDSHGSQCWSLPVRKPEYYLDEIITDEAKDKARNYVRYCIENRIAKKSHGKQVSKTLSEKDYLFFAGTEVFSISVEPIRNEISEAWSPHFSRERDALIAFAELADSRNLEVIYKRHPNLKSDDHLGSGLPSNIILIPDADIYDLILNSRGVATIGSTIIAISSMLKIPSLLMGSNGLGGTGACFELDEVGQLPEIFDQFLEYTPEMEGIHQKNLINFFSWVSFNYHFSYSKDHLRFFKRGPDKAALLIADLCKGMSLEAALSRRMG